MTYSSYLDKNTLSLQYQSVLKTTPKGEIVIKRLGGIVTLAVDSTRVIAGILNPIGTKFARKAEEDLRAHLSMLHEHHCNVDKVLTRFTEPTDQ